MQKPASTGINHLTVPAVCTVPSSVTWISGQDAGSAMQKPILDGTPSAVSELNLMVMLVMLVPLVPVVVMVSLTFPLASPMI